MIGISIRFTEYGFGRLIRMEVKLRIRNGFMGTELETVTGVVSSDSDAYYYNQFLVTTYSLTELFDTV